MSVLELFVIVSTMELYKYSQILHISQLLYGTLFFLFFFTKHSVCNVRRMITVVLSWGFNIAGGVSSSGTERTYVHGVAAMLVLGGVALLEQGQREGGEESGDVKEE